MVNIGYDIGDFCWEIIFLKVLLDEYKCVMNFNYSFIF